MPGLNIYYPWLRARWMLLRLRLANPDPSAVQRQDLKQKHTHRDTLVALEGLHRHR